MRSNFAWRTLGTIPLFLLLASSCTALYDLSSDQCGSNDDCVARFGAGYSCDVGICKSGLSEGGSGGKGNSGGKGGVAGGTSGSDIGADGGMGDGGTSPSGGTEPTAGTAGTAGSGPVAECASHKDCFGLYDDSEENPRACIQGACVPLLSDDCPVVMPLEDNPSDGNKNPWNLLKSTNALILGAFAPFSGDVVQLQANNFNFALWEFTGTTQGISIENRAKPRQIVTV